MRSYASPLLPIYNNNDANSGSAGTLGGAIANSTWSGTASLPEALVLSDQYFGVFIQFQGWASAAGASTGVVVPGSEVEATFTGSFSSFEVDLPLINA